MIQELRNGEVWRRDARLVRKVEITLDALGAPATIKADIAFRFSEQTSGEVAFEPDAAVELSRADLLRAHPRAEEVFQAITSLVLSKK